MFVEPVDTNHDLNGESTMTDNKLKNYRTLRVLGRAENARPF